MKYSFELNDIYPLPENFFEFESDKVDMNATGSKFIFNSTII